MKNKNILIMGSLAVIALIVFSFFSTSAAAKKNMEGIEVSWTDEQGKAVIDQPVKWTRTISVSNPYEKEKKVEIDSFPTHTKFINKKENKGILKYEGKKVEYKAPPGTSSIVVEYETPAPTAKISVLSQTDSEYRLSVVVSAKTDVDYQNVDVPIDIPNLSRDWHYFAYMKDESGNYVPKVKYVADLNGDKGYEKMGVYAPHMSTQEFIIGGEVSPSRIRNYDLETVRNSNRNLPELWFVKEILELALEDDAKWVYAPLDIGYGSLSALKIKNIDYAIAPSGRIYAEPFSGTGSTFNLTFNYKLSLAEPEICDFEAGTEVIFSDGVTSDTSYTFCITGHGLDCLGSDFIGEETELEDGWKRVSLTSTAEVSADEYVRFYFSTQSCGNSPESDILLDDVLLK